MSYNDLLFGLWLLFDSIEPTWANKGHLPIGLPVLLADPAGLTTPEKVPKETREQTMWRLLSENLMRFDQIEKTHSAGTAAGGAIFQ